MLGVLLAAALLAQGPSAPDLAIRPPDAASMTERARAIEQGPFSGGELAGAGAGVLLGDAAVIGIGYGTFQLFTSGTISPTATHFRNAAFALGATALLLPPLAAALGGRFAQAGPARGAFWKAFLLSTIGHALALGVGYRFAPNYWAILPVQLATMTAATSFGLHWGSSPRSPAIADRAAAPAGAPPPSRELAAYAPRLCLDVR